MKTGKMFYKRFFVFAGILMLLMLFIPAVSAQEPVPLRVEAATTGQLTTANPSVVYSFSAFESTRMSFVFDVQGDMQVTVSVLGTDATTVLATSSGSNNNGLVVRFPGQGTYFVSLQGTGGTSAAYRLMIDADPALPINAFVLQSYPARGSSSICEENAPTTFFTSTDDLNICFTLALIADPMELTVIWYAPDGQVVSTQPTTITPDDNYVNFRTSLGYDGQNPFGEGWWQVHFLLNGELAHIHWLTISG